MWPLKKLDPDPEITPEECFFATLLMAGAVWLWQMVFFWWPVWNR